MRHHLVSWLALSALLGASQSARAQGAAVGATVTGLVRDVTGNPVLNAEVRVEGTKERTMTNEHGQFVVHAAPGDVRLIVRRLGFRPAALDVHVEQSVESRVDVELEQTAQRMAPVTVSARAEASEQRLSGFYERAAKKTGYFIGPERLDRITSHNFTDVMREVPGLRIITLGGRGGTQKSIRLRGANCAPFVFVDGFPASAGEFDVDMIDPSTIEGVEIYHGMATVPAQFLAPLGLERCGVIAFWSRPARPGQVGRRADRQPRKTAEPFDSTSVFTAERVDVRAELKAGTGIALYPDSLWTKGIPGSVLTEFIVDTAGFAETETIGIVSSTNEAFANAARAAVRLAEFKPALKNGRAVRQVVQLPFVFLVPEKQK